MITFEESSLEKLIIDSKKKYGSVFSIIVGEELFLFRLLTKKEYEIVVKSSAGDEDLKEEMVCQYAVIYPENINFSTYKAGIPSALAPSILYESGFVSADKAYQYLYESRINVLDNFTEQAAIVIISAFPSYTFEDIEEWDIEKILLMAARAEWKLNIIDGNDFVFSRDTKETEEEEVEKTEEDEKQALKELEQKIIEHGGDPILQLYEKVYRKDRKFFDLPLIMGNNIHREDVVDAVRKSIHERLSKQ